MSLDDVALSVQRALDRFIRRLRRGGPSTPTRRRLLIVQIDGLSRDVLARGLRSGQMPFLQRLLERHGYVLEPMTVGLPTSTTAFQMSAMYGVRPDIPGFHYYDRERRADIHFPRAGHAAYVEAKQATGRAGHPARGQRVRLRLHGRRGQQPLQLCPPDAATGQGLVCALSAFVVMGWVLVKNVVRSIIELVRAGLRFVADPAGARQNWRWLTIQLGISVWVRGLFTLAVSRDLYAGSPAVYVNYLDYDVVAHAFGPQSRRAVESLRRVDRSIRQLWRVARRVPEHQYDLYILSDHGQALSTPYRDLTGGKRLERWIFDEFLDRAGAGKPEGDPRSGLTRGINARRRRESGLFQHFLNYLDEDFLRREDPEAYEQGGLRAIAAGPNAFLYVLDTTAPLDAQALEHRFPGLAEALSQSSGVGFVLARSGDGPVCFWRGKRYQLRAPEPGPFAGRPDAALVVQGIQDLMAMPSAGDLVIYGIDAPQGHVSFIPELGAGTVKLPLPTSHPIQLYDHFIRYQQPS
jgi:hypothetical protein